VKFGRVLITAVTAAAVAGAAGAAAIGFGGGADRTPTSTAEPPATAPVTRTTLYDREEHDGTLGHGTETAVGSRLGGTVTWLPAAGTVVRRGQALYRVDDTPVVLLHGTLPAYRDLRTGTEGADVRQFETELRALGYTGFTVDDGYTSSTAAAVERWQKALGLEQTGAVALGRVVYAAGPVRVAGVPVGVGEPAQGTVLNVSGIDRVVTVALEVSDRRLATTGAAVSVELPGGRTVAGTIGAVETVIKPAQGDAEASTEVEVTVALAAADQSAVDGFDLATVGVTFTVAERKDVLTVPVAALLALAEGGYGVQVVHDGATRVIAVETGLFSGGRVEVSGGGIAEGMIVVMPS
jgi:peptidoglycan hydrolase-like protein with peptidoglycan-binding domain